MGANAGAFVGFGKGVPLELHELKENFRSSQAICDVSFRMSEKTTPDEARVRSRTWASLRSY
jgi:hypothetical protein